MQITRNRNLTLLTDSYKPTHAPQYPPDTQFIHAYWEARVGAAYPTNAVIGLQYFVKEYLLGQVVDEGDVSELRHVASSHFGRDGVIDDVLDGWTHIVRRHDGRLPLRICAAPEGLAIHVSNVLLTIENTDPKCWWLTNYIETLLSNLWYPSTVGAVSRATKQVMRDFLLRTGCESIDEVLPFMLHDFGQRGVEGPEAMGFGGIGHLMNFVGTDNLQAIQLIERYYRLNPMSPFPGFSVPASEHSTITSWGEDGEEAAYENILKTYPSGVVACVVDSWDSLKAIQHFWGGSLREKVLSRDGRLVIRLDSGEPIHENLRCIEAVAEAFGTRVNHQGYRVLDDHVRLLQGDGMTLESVTQLLEAATANGWASENWVFGMGGGLVQKVNRDVQRMSIKCSHAVVDGEGRDVFKRPATDPLKNSKRGRLALTRNDAGNLTTVREEELQGRENLLQPVFENGQLLREMDWAEVVDNASL